MPDILIFINDFIKHATIYEATNIIAYVSRLINNPAMEINVKNFSIKVIVATFFAKPKPFHKEVVVVQFGKKGIMIESKNKYFAESNHTSP